MLLSVNYDLSKIYVLLPSLCPFSVFKQIRKKSHTYTQFCTITKHVNNVYTCWTD